MAANPAPSPVHPDLMSRLLDHAPSPILAADGAEHIVRYVNRAFCLLMGKPAEHILGQPFCRLLPEMQDCTTLLARVYHSGKPESHTEQQHSQPHPVFWSYTIWPALVNERPVGVVIQVTEAARFGELTLAMNEALMLGSVRQHQLTEVADLANAELQTEIKERKLAEKSLQQAQLSGRAGELERLVIERTTELTATNQQLEAFVYSIAHDLRAPLRAMQGFSAMLVEEAGTALNDVGKRYAARIGKSAQFMDALLCDLLAFSRISQQRVELTPLNLETIVQSVLYRVQKEIEEKNARVSSSGPWPNVLAHEATLSQVLVNLTSNALKFVGPGVIPVVRLRAEERAEFVRVWVEDNGIGIAPDYQAQIFGVFTRLNAEKYPGTGIGLAIVQKGVERMGGRVGVESVPL